MDIFLKIIDMVFGSDGQFTLGDKIMFGVFIFLLAILIIWPLARFYYKRYFPMEKKISDHSESIKTLETNSDCINHSKRIEKSEGSLQRIDNKLNYISGMLEAMRLTPKGEDDLLRAHSPIKLTEKGEELMRISFATECLNKHSELFFEIIKSKKPQNGSDVDQNSFDIIVEYYNNETFSAVRAYVFEHPNFDGSAINDSLMMKLIAIKLRQMFLDVYPGFEEEIQEKSE